MDHLIDLIVARLKSRESKQLIISSKEIFDDTQRGMTDYLHYRHLYITDVGALLLKKIAEKDEKNPWVNYIYNAFDYDCEVSCQLSFQHVNLISPELLVHSPLKLYATSGHRYISFSGDFITYEQVARLSEQMILIVLSGQRMTDLAKERLLEKKIIWIERSGTKC